MSTPKPILNAENLALTNKRIGELKKKVMLAEGQKKAYTEEWNDKKKAQNDRMAELRKEVRDLTNKLSYLHNPTSAKAQKNVQEIKRRVPLPPGAKSVAHALRIVDLKVIDLNKQTDVTEDRMRKRERHFKQLVEQYQALVGYRDAKCDGSNPPETIEEDANRKLITRLENEIHRTTVQWMEAEHIRKKYRGIKSSLMRDAEKFESSLLELEQAITEQQAEINKLEEVHKEAVQMRDSTKTILQRQEQTTHYSNKAREKQAQDFRRQVEERKLELERLERKIFSSGKTLIHQESILSGSGEHGRGGDGGDDGSSLHDKDGASEMEQKFKKLMQATGVSAASEVVDRFLAQREASARLTYLRTVTENEKKQLEAQRELMKAQLDAFKFADVKDSDVNQEELEKIKNSIEEQKQRREECDKAIEYTRNVFDTIKDALIELLLKLREIEESLDTASPYSRRTPLKPAELKDISSGKLAVEELGNLLEERIKLGLIASGQLAADVDSGLSEDEGEAGQPAVPAVPSPATPPTPTVQQLSPSPGGPASAAGSSVLSTSSPAEDREKPPAYPPVYMNLIAGRTTTQISSTSPGQGTTVVLSDDEGDVPSRSYLKRQANMIIEAKSRRKGFRMPVPKRR
ncbi:coiled-coil domain-containing protein 151 [Anopheles stephensi]|uniref:coiled-coil domain-containing protein 151 n=1 Tax=Anopheles stephensi TaxID=30069 RepID=UPI00165880DB|nr:coiled-coil domain-containing protein 151 [Anopheles stephensi]XP_035892264.1 coiled-coil domain-containing protein 151 [Anopheles stephensi]